MTSLGEFLRARRAGLTPEQVGITRGAPRRVPGLRREEVAELAGISWRYYARLEQGRSRHPSSSVLDAIGRALLLDVDAMTHMRELSQVAATLEGHRPAAPPAADALRPGIVELVDRWCDQPVIVVGRYRDVLAANRLASLLNPSFQVGRNLLRDAFLDPAAREIYPDWEEVAAGAIAGVRATAGDAAGDARLALLVRELSATSPEFARMWARHEVTHRSSGVKRYRTARAGLITLSYEALAVVGSPGQTVFVFSAQPGSADAAALRELATRV